MLSVRKSESAAVLVVPNVKVTVESQHSVPPMSLHDLLGGSLT